MKRVKNGLFYYLLILCYFIVNINSVSVSINDENDLIKYLGIDTIDILSIEINENNIDILNKININKNIKTIFINGISNELSVLKFNSISSGFIFNNTINEISLSNLTIFGHLEFNNIQKVKINNVTLNGSMNFAKNSNHDELAYINNFYYTVLSENEKKNCINLYGNIIISNSSFYGNEICDGSLLSYNGENTNYIVINNSYFNGNYLNSCLKIHSSLNSEIYFSSFERGRANKKYEGGAVSIYHSYTTIEDCKFNDNFSKYNGGVFNINENLSFHAENIEANNSTASEYGSILYIYSSDEIKTKASIINLNVDNIGSDSSNIKIRGLIASVEGNSSLYMENIYGINLNCGNGAGIFTLSNESSINIRNIELNSIEGKNSGGLLLTSENEKIGSEFKIEKGIFNDLYQHYTGESSTFIKSSGNINITLEECVVRNINGHYGHFIYSVSPSTITLNGIVIENHFSTDYYKMITCENISNKGLCIINLNNTIIKRFESVIDMIYVNKGEVTINNSTIMELCGCFNSFYCNNNLNYIDENKNGVLVNLGSESLLTINDSKIESSVLTTGFFSQRNTNITINNSVYISNSFFKGLILINTTEENLTGHYLINNSSFLYNIGYTGTIINIYEINKSSNITFNNCLFEGNFAVTDGGVIYSKSKWTNLYVSFINCEFIDNGAIRGGISYSLNKNSEPYFSNINELREISDAFVTDPTTFELTPDSSKSISINSGDSITEKINYITKDDYGNDYIYIYYELDSVFYEDLLLFNVESSDTYNTKILGSTISYCKEKLCPLPPIKIIGNPGNYTLKINIIKTRGNNYNEVSTEGANINIIINECKSPNIYYDIKNIGLKSCYIPECVPSCNSGNCINNNMCDCTKTNFKGLYCNEYEKLKRHTVIDYIIRIIAIILAIITIILIYAVIHYRGYSLLKSASVDFLIIILIGIILNIVYIYTLTIGTKTKIICIIANFSLNLGFSLVYGSILVKTYRIYKIFRFVKKQNIGISKTRMFLIIITIGMVYTSILFLWVLFDKVKVSLYYTNELKEYGKCSYPKSKVISNIFSLIILFLGGALTYSTRNLDDKFKEEMTVPIYTYVITMLIMEIITNMNFDINIVVQDLINAIGTIIHTSITIHFLYFSKFKRMYYREKTTSTLRLKKSHASGIEKFNSRNVI